MLFSGFWDWENDKTLRHKRPGPKSVSPPSLPPPATSQTEITEQAAKAGETEGRRLRKKTGRGATRLTPPEQALIPAQIARAGLKTKLGATV